MSKAITHASLCLPELMATSITNCAYTRLENHSLDHGNTIIIFKKAMSLPTFVI